MFSIRTSYTLPAIAATLAVLSACSATTSESTPETAVESVAEHVAGFADKLEPYECGELTRLHTFGGIFLGSQPSPSDLEQAKMGGIKTVINQRPAAENKEFDESAVVASLGLNYYNPGWNGPDQLTDEILDETRELMRTAERPMLMHCSSANRTGATWLAYRVLDEGLAIDAALGEAKTVGLRSPDYERVVLDYIARRQAQPTGA